MVCPHGQGEGGGIDFLRFSSDVFFMDGQLRYSSTFTVQGRFLHKDILALHAYVTFVHKRRHSRGECSLQTRESVLQMHTSKVKFPEIIEIYCVSHGLGVNSVRPALMDNLSSAKDKYLSIQYGT